MTKEDFIKKFPDVKVQQFETAVVFSYREAQETVDAACTSLGMGIIYMERQGRKITCFTSAKMKTALDKMVKGAKLTDPNTNEEGTVTSDKPFLMGGEYCVNVDFPSDSGAYSCEYFID